MINISEMKRLTGRRAFEKYLKSRFDGDQEKLISEINSSLNKLLQTDLKEAGRFLKAVRKVGKYLSEPCQPRFLAVEARYDHWRGENDIALKKYEKAISWLTRLRNFEAAARARIGLMDVYMYLGRYRQALRVGKQALSYFKRKGDIRAARVMTNIGNIYHRMDRNRLALGYYDRARRLFAVEGGLPLAAIDFNRANIYANQNQLDQAEKLYARAADTYRNHNLGLNAAKAEYSLAYLYFLKDKYTKALTMFENALDTFTYLGDKKAVATTRLDLAEINNHLNQYGSAVMLAHDAAPDFERLGLRYERAKAEYFTAEALMGLKDYEAAAGSLRKSEALFRREDNILWQGMAELMHCRILLESGKFGPALNLALKAQRKFKESGDRRRRTDAEIALAQSYFGGGYKLKAVRLGKNLLEASLAGYQKHALLDLLGDYHFDKGQFQEALGYYKKAIAVVEKSLMHLYPDEIKFFFVADKTVTFSKAVECLRLTRQTKASFLQHSQALAMMNQLQPNRKALSKSVPQSLLDEYDQLRANLKKLNRSPNLPSMRGAVSPNLNQLEQRIWATERKARSYVYPGEDHFASHETKIRDYTKMLQPNEMIISYTNFKDSVGAFCVTGKDITYIPLPISYSELLTVVRELHFLTEKSVHSSAQAEDCGKVIKRYLGSISDSLIKPLSLPPGGRLIFLVDNIFIQIPYPALKSAAEVYLKDAYDINVIVNPDDLQNRKNREAIWHNKRSSIFAVSSPGLPMVDYEAESLKEIFPEARLYKGSEAGGCQLKSELARSEGIIHIAAHASRASENPLFSRILLSDGPFFPFDLFDSGIKAQLVTLSGCQTAAPGIYYGNTFSLAKIFYQCGARFVLASLWSVSDKVSARFMLRFYKSLKASGDISRAYREALNETLTGNDNPAYWSCFVLLGL